MEKDSNLYRAVLQTISAEGDIVREEIVGPYASASPAKSAVTTHRNKTSRVGQTVYVPGRGMVRSEKWTLDGHVEVITDINWTKLVEALDLKMNNKKENA